jgi:hypothetical protein
LFQLAAVVLIHRSVDAAGSRRATVLTIVAALTAAANMLIRSAGISVVLAIGLWLLKERHWKRAVLFCITVAACAGPWMFYARAHAPTPQQRAIHGGSMRWAGDPASGTVTLRDIPARVGVNVADVTARAMGGIFMPELFRGPAESGEEIVALGGAAGLGQGSMGSAGVTMAISVTLSALVLLGFLRAARRRATVAEFLVPITLCIIFVWPFWTFRFLVPLTPYLFFYLVTGLATLAPSRIVRIALLSMIGLHVWDHGAYIRQARGSEGSKDVTWIVQARETNDILDWLDGHTGDGLVATTNPALVYLRTGHKTLSFDRPIEDWSVWRARGVRYVVCLVAVELPSRGDFKVRYRSPSGFWVIEI